MALRNNNRVHLKHMLTQWNYESSLCDRHNKTKWNAYFFPKHIFHSTWEQKKVADDFISFMFNFNAYVLDFKKEEKKTSSKGISENYIRKSRINNHSISWIVMALEIRIKPINITSDNQTMAFLYADVVKTHIVSSKRVLKTVSLHFTCHMHVE